MWFLTLLKGISIKDMVYAGIIVALIGGFTWYTYHERAIGAKQQTALTHRLEVKQQAKVKAINAQNKIIMDKANEKIRILTTDNAIADANLSRRMHDNTGKNRIIFMPETVCSAPKLANNATAKGGTKATTTANKRVIVSAKIISDDLHIALDHNEQLQTIITEFKKLHE